MATIQQFAELDKRRHVRQRGRHSVTVAATMVRY
jgi:hypothetical protein